ncbi:VCBS repeat-containing protein, partial [Streptomyces sp. NPDC051577]|uniref:FG-GAP repeat domain-containing protein n=1 Tax=Streptomyces sp. NPDC051577 TaxID=3155166 RepID=UPI003438F002
DLNGDGTSDIVSWYGEKLYVYLVTIVDGRIEISEHTLPVANPTFNETMPSHINDFDGDGTAEIISDSYLGRTGGKLRYYKYLDGTFVAKDLTVPSYMTFSGAAPFDVNGDGKFDFPFTVRYRLANLHRIVGGDSLQQFSQYKVVEPTSPQKNEGFGDIDLDGDGTLDSVLFNIGLAQGERGHYHPIDVGMFLSTGTNVEKIFSFDTTIRCGTEIIRGPNGMPPSGPPLIGCLNHVADLNADGRADLVFSASPGGDPAAQSYGAPFSMESGIEVVHALGGNLWGRKMLPALGIHNLSDFNGDGKADLLRAQPSTQNGAPTMFLDGGFSSGEVWYSTGPI